MVKTTCFTDNKGKLKFKHETENNLKFSTIDIFNCILNEVCFSVYSKVPFVVYIMVQHKIELPISLVISGEIRNKLKQNLYKKDKK